MPKIIVKWFIRICKYVQEDQTNEIQRPKQKAVEDGQTQDTIPEQDTFVISGDVNEKQSLDAGK